jgi:class 3 adenylate cyclase
MVSELIVVFNFGLSETAVTNALRVYGENLRRIAQAETGFFRNYILDPMLAAGVPARQMQEISSQSGGVLQPMVRQMILWLYRRHQETAIIQNLIEQTDAALEEAGVPRREAGPPPAIAFLDLTGYTRLTEERGDEVAAELASTLAAFVTSSTRPFGGVPIKWLGDGVMFHFPDPGDGVVSSLEMVEGIPDLGLPPAHVGVHAGPVVFRDGDYFGRTVNIAARIAGRAGPGEVLVSDDLVSATTHPGVRFVEIGPVDLKGVAEPVTLLRAERDG